MTEHENLASALVAALADLTVVETARTAKIELAKGGSYSYKYADIGDVVKVSRPVLADHGVIALTPVHAHGNELACTVTFLHTSGDRLDLGPFPFPHGKDAQATGSMVTYHRRYALVAALGIAAGDDDDGAAAQPRQQAQPERAPLPEGWTSEEECKAAHDEIAATVKASPEPVQSHMREWRREKKLPWPMPRTDLDVMWEEVAAATKPAEEPANGAQAKAEKLRAKAAENAPTDVKAESAKADA